MANSDAQLTAERSAAANTAFENYDMGDSIVAGVNGWESETPGREWTRSFFVENEDDEDGDSTMETFVVCFTADDSAEIYVSYVSGW